ncbi:protein-tyrosine phosphatase family protein [Prauserella cavernicola]|uniref:Protein tyrosine phosphatase n=1 Tax=Prauserella cavernicola TaxID=2800127 RepID=A0A934QST7_9PSEU|nr:protein-tyrosine phosphatase family protein [Prauserella cavernicola]MBK1784709.1 protein tyrosine phosphatase [Prauserella cavernicola]
MAGPPLLGATRLPDGVWVRGRGLREAAPEGPRPDFGLYLGAGVLHRRHDASLTWEHEWVHWVDGWLPSHWRPAAASIVALHERARTGQAVEMACHGGIGRTGTAMACLATLTGLTPREAFAWTRANYRRRAVEAPWQRAWISWFARHARLNRPGPSAAGPEP